MYEVDPGLGGDFDETKRTGVVRRRFIRDDGGRLTIADDRGFGGGRLVFFDGARFDDGGGRRIFGLFAAARNQAPSDRDRGDERIPLEAPPRRSRNVHEAHSQILARTRVPRPSEVIIN